MTFVRKSYISKSVKKWKPKNLKNLRGSYYYISADSFIKNNI